MIERKKLIRYSYLLVIEQVVNMAISAISIDPLLDVTGYQVTSRPTSANQQQHAD